MDVLRDCKKFVLVAVDNFSGFVSTTFLKSETAEELRDGIIRSVTPFMTSSLNRVRVDRAPGFGKLANQSSFLANMRIDMELGDAKNKNAVGIVDQKMKELRAVIRKVCPASDILNELCLAKATTAVNETIRHHRLSAKEIQFSRDLATNSNLPLNDEDIAEAVTKLRADNNQSTARSKNSKPALPAEASTGQLVLIKEEGDKRSRRDLYMVLETDKEGELIICKVRDILSNKLASMSPQDQRYRYRVRQEDVILAPDQPRIVTRELANHAANRADQLNQKPDNNYEENDDNYYGEGDGHEDEQYEEDEYQEHHEHENHLLLSDQTVTEDEEDGYEDVEHWSTAAEPIQDHDPGLLLVEVKQNHQVPPVQVQEEQHQEEQQQEIYQEDQEAAQEAEETQESDSEEQEAEEHGYEADSDDLLDEEQEYEEEEGAVGGFDMNNINQSRQPVMGDIIIFFDEDKDGWIVARIREKVRGYKNYYNVDLEDGGEDGLYCKPPTKLNIQKWSLLENYNFNQREQLLGHPEGIPSRQVTPDTSPNQFRLEEQEPYFQEFQEEYQQETLQLELNPDQLLQPGRVHVLPHLSEQHRVQEGTQPIFFTPLEGYPVDMEKYQSRVAEISRGLTGFSPGQDYQRYYHANWIARSEQYNKAHSAMSRMKNIFRKRY